MMNKALKCFKDVGNYDAAIQEWEARPAGQHTWENLKTMMCTKYAKAYHQDSVTAKAMGHSSVHVMKEYAAAIEELVENLTEKHAKQAEALINSNTEAMAKLVELLSKGPTLATAVGAKPANTTESKKRKKWVDKCKAATQCPHCNKIHPNCTHVQCWELDANTAKRPANWKLVKST